MTKELKYNITGQLKKLAQQLAKNYSIKIGLLANKGGSEPIGENLDLAGLGALQEFGADIKITPKMAAYLHFKADELGLPPKDEKGDGYVHIPARSWLYEPLKDKEFMKLVKEQVGNPETFLAADNKEYYKEIAKTIAMVAQLQIVRAFDRGGINGEWAKNSPLTIASKGSSRPLWDTGELWQHVDYEIEEK